jgi:hypothetical protein
MAKKKTMYMHTIEGRPATFAWMTERRGEKVVHVPYMYFASARHPAKLLHTLRHLRMEQRWAINDAKRYNANWKADFANYDYIRVEVP